MSTEFIGFQPPPGDAVANYDPTDLSNHQPASVPQAFKDAMSVREEVYVTELKVPLEKEFGVDDSRAFHWIVYASVGNASQSSSTNKNDGSPDIERRASESTASRVAVGTIRLVPPPHFPHLASESKHEIDDVHGTVEEPARADSVATTLTNEPDEPYIKLGRLATLSPYRGLGLSKLLINAALSWAKEHPQDILPQLSPAEAEAAKLEGKKERKPWKGLIFVHAQTSVQKLWERYGFVKDEGMGIWVEEGIEHVGLWKRIEVTGGSRKGSLVGLG